jgi:hypothetical protein
MRLRRFSANDVPFSLRQNLTSLSKHRQLPSSVKELVGNADNGFSAFEFILGCD